MSLPSLKTFPVGGSSTDDFGTPALTDWYFEPGNNGIDNIFINYIGLWNVVFVFFKTLSFKVSIDLVLKHEGKLSFASTCHLTTEVVALIAHRRRCVRRFILFLKFSSCSLEFLVHGNPLDCWQSSAWQPYLLRTGFRNEGGGGEVLQSSAPVTLCHMAFGAGRSAPL